MRRYLLLTAGTMIYSWLAACSPARILGSIEPAARGGEARGVPYASGPRHAMDIYVPAKRDVPPPVVVFFYGGGWKSGDREAYRFLGRSLAACGALTIIPDYRVWPETGFPGFLEDSARAVAAAREEARRRGGDLSRFFLMGHSAGAYIATMLALDPSYLADAGLDSRTVVSGTIGLAGPYDFLPLYDPELEAIFAPAGPNTQPITFAANAGGPLLLLTGVGDETVHSTNSERLAAKVKATGGRAETILYPIIGHVAIIAAFSRPFRFLAPARADVCRFLGLLPAKAAVG